MVKIYHSIWFIKKAWLRIVAKNPAILPTQSYDYCRHLFYAFYCHLHRIAQWRITFFYYTNGSDECILPLVEDTNNRQLRSLSCFGKMDYDDIISSTSSPTFVRQCLETLCQTYPHYLFEVQNMNERSLLYAATQTLAVVQNPCVDIQLPETYDEYYSSLSKHQRQNIRTSYNRMEKDEISFSFSIYDQNHRIDLFNWHRYEEIYEARRKMRRGNRLLRYRNRLINPYHYILTHHPEHMIFVVSHNDIPMAYMAGLYSETQKAYYVPRLCINDQYAKYSPGIILINETVKSLLSNQTHRLDLMLGDEPYKTAMGGVLTYNYSLQTTTEELLNYVHTA